MDYKLICKQLAALVEGEDNITGILANTSALLKDHSSWLWIGFYIVKDNFLQLGPFQGPPACMSIAFGKGVCGKAWQQKHTIIVPDVHNFEGHIACSSLSKSEIVVPIFVEGKVWGVLDIDSEQIDAFDSADDNGLRSLCDILGNHIASLKPHI